ncbi:MAG: hypothetical protein AAFQ60_15490 [Pseudomonadota bacterium]
MREADELKAALLRAMTDRDTTEDATPSAQLGRILHEIDGVVLPRDLHLQSGKGEVLTLTVKARRLIRIHAPVPRALGTLPGVVDTELSNHENQMAALAHLLAGFAAQVSTLSVSSSEPKYPETLTEIGLTVDQLTSALKDAGYALPSHMDETIARLSEIAKAQSLAWVLFQGDSVTGSGGNTALLRDCIEHALPQIVKSERPAGRRAATWIFGSAEAPRMTVTVEGRACLIAQVPKALIQTWINASSGQPDL